MTISLTVILMETTGAETSFFFPLIITLISAKWVGDYFNEGIYDIQIKENHVPMLPWEPFPHMMGLKASTIMSTPVVCIKLRDKAHYIYQILNSNKHNGFPVVEDVEGVIFLKIYIFFSNLFYLLNNLYLFFRMIVLLVVYAA